MNKKINIYIYGEPGKYDEYNPAYVCNKEYVPEILYIIACNKPFSICKKDIINKLKVHAADLTAIKHGIDMKEISVELWHQVFGATNEYLVKKRFVEVPEYRSNEGRYLRSFVIKNIKEE